MTLGIRDTRKTYTWHNMTEGDVRDQGRFEDSLGIFTEFMNGYGLLFPPTTGRYFQLPYRALVPKTIENLICAGHITGRDKVSHAAMRNMMCCTVSGQAAGVAAALSVLSGKPNRDLSIKKVTSGTSQTRGEDSLIGEIYPSFKKIFCVKFRSKRKYTKQLLSYRSTQSLVD